MIKRWAFLAAAAACLAGCASGRTFGGYDATTHVWKTAQGDKVEDRVSGELIDPNSAIKREYLGQTYYFENEFTTAVFERDPGWYDYAGYNPFYDSP